jgi:hypothetical protein
MNATTHPVAPAEVMAFLDGELSADRSQTVSAHINECAECGEVRDSFGNTSQSLTDWTIPAVPVRIDDLVLRASAAINNVPEIGFIPSLQRFLRRRPSLTLAGAGFVGLLIFLGLFSQRPLSMVRHAPRSAGDYEASAPPAASPVAGGHYRGEGLILPEKGKNLIVLDRAQNSYQSGPMIARTVSLSLVVKDFEAARASLDAILARHNGYTASLNVTTPQGAARTLQASLRIPAPQLATALAELKVLGRVEAEHQNGEEVTQQHADLVARLKNSRETEQRLQAILEQRTGKISDVLSVEQEIARVRGEIEQMEAEQKTLEHRVDFATIDLKLAEEYKAQLSTPAPSVAMQVRNAIINGFRSAFESLLALVVFLAESGPSLLLWLALLGLPAWRLWRRYRRAQSLGSPAGA